MHLITLLLLFAQATPTSPMPPIQKPLFAAEKWYQDAKGEEQEFEGVLEINPGNGRIGLPGRFNSFRLIGLVDSRPVMRQVHTSGKDQLLSPFIGHNVKLTGKLVEQAVSDGTRTEIWPAKMEVIGLAPAGVIAEWKILARTSNYYPTQLRALPMPTVIRSVKELVALNNIGGTSAEAAATAATSTLNQHFRPTQIDWSKHMLIHISGGGRNNLLGRIVITKITFGEKGLDVHWKLDHQGGGNRSAETVLVQKSDDDVNFIQEGVSRTITIPGPKKEELKVEPMKK